MLLNISLSNPTNFLLQKNCYFNLKFLNQQFCSLKAMLDEFKKSNPLASVFKLKNTNGDNKDMKNGRFSTDSLFEGNIHNFNRFRS